MGDDADAAEAVCAAGRAAAEDGPAPAKAKRAPKVKVSVDEEVFDAPFEFRITRNPNRHLGFGIGPHFCLGANLARLEIQIMFEELLRRLPDIELAGPVERLRSNFINGVKRMPVRFTPERR